jgi:YbbR domain-containing protein
MAIKLLDGATAEGVSTSHPVRMKPRNHTVQVTITGAPTAVTVDLEGSLDDTTYVSLASYVLTAADLTAAAAMFHVVDKPVRYVRVNLVTLTAGTAPTVTALYEGETA